MTKLFDALVAYDTDAAREELNKLYNKMFNV